MLRTAEARKPAGSTPAFDTRDITVTIQRALASAGLDTQSGPMKSVTDTIERALSSAGLAQNPGTPASEGVTIDGVARDITPRRDAKGADAGAVPGAATQDAATHDRTAQAETAQAGQFLSRSFTCEAGTRAYRLYIPATYRPDLAEPVPAIVMLHGCTQSPEDFATGTRMNALADRHGFLVIYPAQPAQANPTKCWNWFRPEDQRRALGEPALIAGITREVVAGYRIDPKRIFVAGMSAGAAMAVVLGETYPDLFAAVGAHSGLDYGVAHDVPSAMVAMKGSGVVNGQASQTASSRGSLPQRESRVPTIVFHGDRDMTVNVRNGAAIVDRVTAGSNGDPALRPGIEDGLAASGRTCRRTTYVDSAGRVLVEYWILTGAGHAWSGGNPAGSFTDARGPDASAEMVRFFQAQNRDR